MSARYSTVKSRPSFIIANRLYSQERASLVLYYTFIWYSFLVHYCTVYSQDNSVPGRSLPSQYKAGHGEEQGHGWKSIIPAHLHCILPPRPSPWWTSPWRPRANTCRPTRSSPTLHRWRLLKMKNGGIFWPDIYMHWECHKVQEKQF